MIQEPCASDGTLAWVSESAEQAVNTPNDEERLEQMSHPKNKAMERMTPPKGGMDLLGSARKAMERSCLISWSGVQVTACPKRNAFDSSGFLCLGALGDPPLPFLHQTNQGQAMETAPARAHKQTTAQATIQDAPKADVSRKTLDRHVLEESSGMDTDGHALVCSKSIHQRSQPTGCVLVRKAPTNPHSQKLAQVKADCDGASNDYRERYAMSSPLGQAVT